MATTGFQDIGEAGLIESRRPGYPTTRPYPRGKRALDLGLGAVGAVAALPLLAAMKVGMVATGDRGPFLYRATRVGEGALPIIVYKVRTMDAGSVGAAVTARDDPRVTRVGAILRRYKLDELPQLWNVLRGHMALVGPRPEDPAYVDLGDPIHRRVFSARPGITGLAQLAFRNESELLGGDDPERAYREEVQPAKLRLDVEYLDHQSIRLDLRIMVRTLAAVIGR